MSQDAKKKPSIGVILGSSSDLPKVKNLFDTLDELEIGFEVAVISAHRTPDLVKAYAEKAKSRGIGAIIACAGLSAALPGALASWTQVPVIGVPLDAGPLHGVDALLSIAQMPPGVPVGAMGIDGGKNAALFAARILALHDEWLSKRLSDMGESMAQGVLEKGKVLLDKGFAIWQP